MKYESLLTRRVLLKRAVVAGLGVSAVGPLLSACGSSSAPRTTSSANLHLTGNNAQRAVEAAKQFKGQTVNLTYEAGLQSNNPLYVKDLWEKSTGVTLNVVQIPFVDEYSKELAAHIAGSSSYDVLLTSPDWLADFVREGVCLPEISSYMKAYGNPTDFGDLPKTFLGFERYNGKQVGLLTDGDDLILYYRKDLFDDPANQAAFRKENGFDLQAPRTWTDYIAIARFFTKHGSGQFWGTGNETAPGQVYNFFFQRYCAYGGYYFDSNDMKPLINGRAGIAALTEMLKEVEVSPPGAANWDFGHAFTAFIEGKTAMLILWPPIGKFAGGYGYGQPGLSFVPKSQIRGKVGYATPPGGHPQFADGYDLTISSNSRNKTLAYLFAQWYTSPTIMQKWISDPASLGKPCYLSQFDSPTLAHLFPTAKEWLATMKANALAGPHPNVIIPGGVEYMRAVDGAVTEALAGTDPQVALNQAAVKWEDTTKRLGRNSQRQAYLSTLLPLEKASVTNVG